MNAIHRKKLRTVAIFTLATTLMGLAIGSLFVAMGEPAFWAPRMGAVLGAAIGFGVGLSEEFLIARMSRTRGYVALNAQRLLLYGTLIGGSIIVGNAILNSATSGVPLARGVDDYLREGILFRDLGFAAVAALLAVSGLQISKLYRFGEIVQLLTGRYYYPEEEDRIVLFADIADSSAVVERLTPLAASSFLRDCFSDISEPVVAWRGFVYQHLGDGVVITWPNARATDAERSVQCFFEMRRVLETRAAYYRATYGVAPNFRAGLHAGRVTATWVGEAKRELALHGDVLHVAARLQSLCRELDTVCLVSQDWMNCVNTLEELEVTDLGPLQLRGRSGDVYAFSIETSLRRD